MSCRRGLLLAWLFSAVSGLRRNSNRQTLVNSKAEAQVRGIRLVSPRGDGPAEPAVIAWERYNASTVSAYAIESLADDGVWTLLSAESGLQQTAALWLPACTVRVGVIGDDLLAKPSHYSEPLSVCEPAVGQSATAPMAACSTLGNARLISVSTRDTEVQIEWDVSPTDQAPPALFRVEMRRWWSWREVMRVPAASLPGPGGCRSQAAKVRGLSPASSYTLRVTAEVDGRTVESQTVAVRTLPPQCSQSLLGQPLFAPSDDPMRTIFSVARVSAQRNYDIRPSELNTVWLARVDGFLYNWDDALELLAKGEQQFPESFRVPRHIGHRMLGRRDTGNATSWLELARKRVQGVPATAEFFPLAIAPFAPGSSSQFNIYYHLGLSYLLAGNYAAAAAVYEEGIQWAFTEFDEGDDAFLAMNYWRVNSYQRIGTPEAIESSNKVLANISSDPSDYTVVDDLCWGYYHGLLLWKGDVTPRDLLKIATELGGVRALETYGYAAAQYLNLQRDQELQRQARQLLSMIRANPQWSSFGYLGAEYDLFRGRAAASALDSSV